MQSEIDGPAKNNKIKAENIELKARVAKLEDKQSQNDDHVLIWRNFGWVPLPKCFFLVDQ